MIGITLNPRTKQHNFNFFNFVALSATKLSVVSFVTNEDLHGRNVLYTYIEIVPTGKHINITTYT